MQFLAAETLTVFQNKIFFSFFLNLFNFKTLVHCIIKCHFSLKNAKIF